MNELTPKDAKRKAKNAVEYSLDELINPSDVMDGATEWSEVPDEKIKRECYDSAEMMLLERQEPWNGLVHDLAIQEWYKSMPRVSMDHLETDDRELVVTEYGYWPNSMNKWTIQEILQECKIPTDVYYNALEEVERGIVEGMKP